MFPFEISHVSLLRHPAKIELVIASNALSLIASGMVRRRMYGKDLAALGPMITFTLRGEHLQAQYGPDRETWTIFFHDFNIRRIPGSDWAELGRGKGAVRLPLFVPIPGGEIGMWRVKFRTVFDAFSMSIQQNIFCAHVGVMDLFRSMIEREIPSPRHGPAQQLKALIDADTRFARTLGEMHKECGYSYDHLGMLFRKTYSMTPNDYRNQRRMAAARQLISDTHLSAKEISGQLGFSHLSAFSAMFRRLAGYSPREAVKRYRRYAGSA